jgi:hypothetical protein
MLFLTGLNRPLLHAICWATIVRFTEDVLRPAIECWQWLLSARRDLTLPFIQEMLGAWQVGFRISVVLHTHTVDCTLRRNYDRLHKPICCVVHCGAAYGNI